MKIFQKIISLFLLVGLLFSLAACGKKPQAPTSTAAPTETASPTETVTPTETTAETSFATKETAAPTEVTQPTVISEPTQTTKVTTTVKPTQAATTSKPQLNIVTAKPTVSTTAITIAATSPSKEPSVPTVVTVAPTAIAPKPTVATSAPTTATTIPTVPTAPVLKVVVNTEGMTDLQKAVVITAESYYLRGKWAQYDQYNLTSKTSGGIQNVPRRLTGVKAPEDYTSQNYGYTDCSGFVYDVYNFALGMPITTGERNTKAFCSGSVHTILCEYPEKEGFSQLSNDALAAIEKKFTDTLQPGDIIVYRNAGNTSGHAMLYVGNGMMIHSTGSTYDFSAGTDKVENSGTYRYESIKTLLTKGNRRSLFDKYVYIIMRPLNKFTDEIPADTLSRMDLMRGVVAEKRSSCTYGQTAGPGDIVTYTFKLTNKSNLDKVLTITDTLSPYTSYVSGADKVNENTLSWTVKVAAGESAEISYSVQVNKDAPLGEYIVSNSFVSGIPVNFQRFKIARTLTAEQQNTLVSKLNELKSRDLCGIPLVNTLYEEILGKFAFAQTTTDQLWADLTTLKTRDYILNPQGALYSMIAPSLYGGKNLCELDSSTLTAQERTRLLTANLLLPGDIVLADADLYIYTGSTLTKISGKKQLPYGTAQLEAMLASSRFVVLRPSMVL